MTKEQFFTTASVLALSATAVIAPSAIAGMDHSGDKHMKHEHSQKDVKFKEDAYVTISGTVEEVVDNDEFKVSFSGGTIMVDTNDQWSNMAGVDARKTLKKGTKVEVTGQVDNNLFTKNEIEAFSVTYQDNERTRTYILNKDGANIEYYAPYGYYNEQLDSDEIRLSGTVAKIENEEEFILNFGEGTIRVETDDVYFPNAQRLNAGDQVIVYGEIDRGWFESKELEANAIYRTNYYTTPYRG